MSYYGHISRIGHRNIYLLYRLHIRYMQSLRKIRRLDAEETGMNIFIILNRTLNRF